MKTTKLFQKSCYCYKRKVKRLQNKIEIKASVEANAEAEASNDGTSSSGSASASGSVKIVLITPAGEESEPKEGSDEHKIITDLKAVISVVVEKSEVLGKQGADLVVSGSELIKSFGGGADMSVLDCSKAGNLAIDYVKSAIGYIDLSKEIPNSFTATFSGEASAEAGN